MAFDILGYRNKYKDYFGDASLDEVARDAFEQGGWDKETDFESWKKAKGIDSIISEDLQSRKPPTFMDKLRGATSSVAPADDSILGEIPKGLKAGVEQVKGMGYGLGVLAGKVIDSDIMTKWGTEGLADVEANTPKPQVASFTDINSGSDLAKYLAYGISTNIPNMAISIGTGGVGGFLGKKAVQVAAKEAIEKAVAVGATKEAAESIGRDVLAKGITRGAVAGAGAASIDMEAGSIAGDQLQETGDVDPLRTMAGAIPAGLLDVLPEYKLAKKLGWMGKDAAKFAGNRVVQSLKVGAQQFLWEAPTEAMQSVIERASVKGKSIADFDAAEEYMNSFILGGLTGAVVGGGSHAVTGLIKGKQPTEDDQALDTLQKKASLDGMIYAGMKEGNVAGHPFTPDDALAIIQHGQKEGLYTESDIDRFKEKYPALQDGLNNVAVESMKEKVSEVVSTAAPASAEIDVPDFQEPEEINKGVTSNGQTLQTETEIKNKEISYLKNSIARQADLLDNYAGQKGADEYKAWEESFARDKARLDELTGSSVYPDEFTRKLAESPEMKAVAPMASIGQESEGSASASGQQPGGNLEKAPHSLTYTATKGNSIFNNVMPENVENLRSMGYKITENKPQPVSQETPITKPGERRSNSEKASFIRNEVEINSARERMAGRAPDTVQLVKNAEAKWNNEQGKADNLPSNAIKSQSEPSSQAAPETSASKGIADGRLPEETKNKEPWQMTRKEWDRQVDPRDMQGMSLDEAIKMADEKGEGEYSNDDNIALIQRRWEAHKKVVQKALAEGKSVPSEVLKDYPDLVKADRPSGETVTKAPETGVPSASGLEKSQNDKRQAAIDKYAEHAKKHMSEANAKSQAEKWVKAIDAKDYKTLRNIMNGINPQVNRLFTALTGLPAKTQKEADASLRSFDPAGWDKWQAEKNETREKKAAENDVRYKQQEIDALLDKQIQYKGEALIYRELYRRLVDEGYDTIEEQKRGATSHYDLANNTEGRIVSIPKKILVPYVQELIDNKKAAQKQESKSEAEEPTKAEAAAPDLSQKSTGELVSDIFSIINNHVGSRGSISNRKIAVEESLYQKLKPYLKEIVSRAKAKALDVKAYLFGAVDSMPNGTAKAVYEAAAERYIEEDKALPQKEDGVIINEVEKEVEENASVSTREQAAGTPEDDRGSLAGESTEPVSGIEEGKETSNIPEGQGSPDDGELQSGVGSRDESTGGKGLLEEGAANNRNGKNGLGGNNGDVSGLQRFRNHRIEPGSIKREGGWKATAKTNLDIIELVKKLEAEGRQATPEEQKLLAKYTGWGASEIANNLFPGYAQYGEIKPDWAKPEWKPLVDRLVNLLTPEEIKTAAKSTQYAHYTSEAVIRSIYNALDRFGFNGGKILEPGMGVGSFAGLIPDNMVKGSSYTGIEMDGITAKIAKYLYPGHNVLHGDYTAQAFPNNFFDLGVGNPPFSQTVILSDPAYKKNRFKLHDYFFAKTIDKVRPGGILVFITSRYTMDKQDNRTRRYLAERADLLGAIRLPQTAFQQNAGTEVVTDVLFLRKKTEGEETTGQAWDKLAEVTTPEGPAMINEYFAEHPEMVLGKNSLQGSMYGANQYTVIPEKGTDIEEQFAAATENLPQNVYSIVKKSPKEQEKAVVERDFNPKNKKEGGLYISATGEIMENTYGSGVPLSSTRKVSDNDQKWLKDYIALRDAVKQCQYDQLTDGPWEKSLKALQKEYKSFVKKNGKLKQYTITERTSIDDDGNEQVYETRRFKNDRLLKMDVEHPLVLSAEDINENGDIIESPFLSGRTIGKPVTAEIKTTADALAVTLDETGKLDVETIAQRMGRSVNEVVEELGDLIYEEPGRDGYVLADEYLSGEVVKKLEEAIAASHLDSKYKRNVEALKAVQPEPLKPADITVVLGANWVPQEVYNDFAAEVLGLQNTQVTYDARNNSWSLGAAADNAPSWGRRKKKNAYRQQSMRSATNDWGTNDRGPNEILESILNNSTIKITRTEKVGDTTRTYTDMEATTAANEIAKRMRQRFNSWIWEDAERAGEMLDLYNRRYNTIAGRKFDGSHLTLPGVSLLRKLYDHQKRAIWRIIQSGNAYLNHAVGAGKTYTMIAAGMEMRRLGLVKKPLYVVPKHMLQQFANEFMELYPMANIMVADEENFHTTNRRRFIAQASLNNPDAIIITHPSFGKLKMKEESIAPVRDAFLQELRDSLQDMEDDAAPRHKIKQMEKRIEQAEQRFANMVGGAGKDNVVTFEEMGVDFLFVDEAHQFRKLDFTTNRQAKGIDANGSIMAMDLYIKTLWLESQNKGRSHCFASGTPIVNTMGELYTIMRFFNEKQMEEDGIRYFDSWANMFGQMAQGMEMNAAGRYELVERFAEFVNIPELMSRVRMFMDILTSSQLGGFVKRPEIKGGKAEIVVAPPSEGLKAYQKDVLQPRIEQSKLFKPSPEQPGNPDPLINIITDGRLASIDLRYVVRGAVNDPTSKLNRYIDGIIQSYKETKDKKYLDLETGKVSPIKGGAIICFYNHGFGKSVAQRRGFDARKWLMHRLKEAKIPASEVAWIDDYDTAVKKEAMFKEVRQGTKRILIGSAKKMGTGMNVQRRLAALHYLDPPWYPADVEQPDGRIIRQGNQNEVVDLKRYATKGSYDSSMWQMVSRKSKLMEQAYIGDASVRKIQDLSESSQYEMAAALSSGDERVIRLVGLKAEAETLHRLRGAHQQAQRRLYYDRQNRQYDIESTEKQIKKLKEAEAKVPGHIIDISGKIGKKEYDKREDFGAEVLKAYNEALNNKNNSPGVSRKIATLNDIPLTLRCVKQSYTQKDDDLSYTALLTLDVTEDVRFSVAEGGPFVIEDGDGKALITKAVNNLNRISTLRAKQESTLREHNDEMKKIKARLGAPFESEQELNEKIAEIAQLEKELLEEGEEVNTGKDEVFDGTPEEWQKAASRDLEDIDPEDEEYSIALAQSARAQALLSQYGKGDIEAALRTLKLAKDNWLEFHEDEPEPKEIAEAQTVIRSISSGQGRLFKGAQYSRRASGARGISTARIQSIVGKVTSTLNINPKINVVQHISECPAAVLKDMEKNGILDENGDADVQGFAWRGETWLVGDNLDSDVEAFKVLMHELTHNGLGALLNDNSNLKSVQWQYNNLMDKIISAHRRDIMTIARTTHTHLNLNTIEGRRQAAEEWLCNQSYEAQHKWYDKLVAIFHNLVRAMGLDIKLSDSEVRIILREAFQTFEGRNDDVRYMVAAWHGSQGQFDKFSSQKIKTGNYGHGLYFSSMREVAEQYKEDGHLYQVTLAPDESDFLDWDRPINKQSRYVQDVLNNSAIRDVLDAYEDEGGYVDTGKDVYFALMKEQGSAKAASQLLSDCGIPGNKYLDSSQGKGGTNYVLFNDQNVNIEARYARKEKSSSPKDNLLEQMKKDAPAELFARAWDNQYDKNRAAMTPQEFLEHAKEIVEDFNDPSHNLHDDITGQWSENPRETIRKAKKELSATKAFIKKYTPKVDKLKKDVNIEARYARKGVANQGQSYANNYQWWIGRDWQKEINDLPLKNGARARNFEKEGYIPITRAEADDLWRNGMGYFVARVEIRGEADTPGTEGYFIKPLTYWNYGGYTYDHEKEIRWQNKEAKAFYRKYRERYLQGEPGNIDAEEGRRTGVLREGPRQERLMPGGVSDRNPKYSIRAEQAYEKLVSDLKSLEKQVDEAYENNDPQAEELDAQLSALKDKIEGLAYEYESESHAVDEGVSLEEELANAYHTMIVQNFVGYSKEEAINNFRAALANRGANINKATDAEILAAAKDAYDQRKAMIDRYNGVRYARRADQTQTPEFKKWFGNSKVVDESGKPLVVYHGTGSGFNSFKEKYPHLRDKYPESRGFYFSSSAEDASEFASLRSNGAGENIIYAYLKIKNPLMVKYGGKIFDIVDIHRYVKQALANGNDGVIIKKIRNWQGSSKTDTYIVFSPTQIKSATGNNGNFDTENPDIRYSIRKPQDPPASSDPKVLNFYLKDETDAIAKTIKSKLHPGRMTWLETILKSPEWFDHPQINKIVKLFMRDRNEIYHETFNELNAADNPLQEHDTVVEAGKALRNKGLSLTERAAGKVSKEYERLIKILDEGDTTWQRNRSKPLAEQVKEFENHIRRQGATADTIAVWKLYRESYDKALDLQTRQMKDMIEKITEEARFKGETPDLTEMNKTLKGALAQMEEWRGFYAPRIREQGDWKVQAYKEHGPLRENREWYREHKNSELSAQRLANKLKREGWKVYNVGKVERLPEGIYQDVNAVATAKLIDDALDKMKKRSDLQGRIMANFDEEILRAVADEIRARGFRSTMIHRKEGAVIRGFIEDPIQRHLLYINQLSGGISKAQVARMAMEELLGKDVMGNRVGGIDPVADPKAYMTAENYIREQLRNLDSSDKIIGIAKSIATFKFLGFNMRSLAVNTTAILTTAPVAIHQYAMGGKGSLLGIMKELGVSGKDYGLVMAGKKLQNRDEQRFIDDMHKKGWDDAQYTREALGELSKVHSKVWSTVMDYSMKLFGYSEKWNRGTTMLAAYRLARKKGLDHYSAAEAAKESCDKAHGVYGRSTLPMWAQGANPAAKIGQMMYVYSKFGHNYMQMLYDMGFKKRNIKGAMFAFLAPLVLAGGAAMPFKDAIFGFAGFILSALFGWKEDPEKWVWDTIRKHLGRDAEKIGRHGLTGAAGVDISGSLSIGVGIPKDFIDLTGAVGGVATELKEAGENLGRGNVGRAAEHLLPSGFANPARALRESSEGVSTRNNRRVWGEDGKPYIPGTAATIARAAGFRSTDQAVLSERTWEGHRQQAEIAERRSAIYEKYRAWLLGGRKREEYKKIVKEVQEFNKRIKDHRLKGESLITSQSLNNQARRMQKPTKKERSILTE